MIRRSSQRVGQLLWTLQRQQVLRSQGQCHFLPASVSTLF
eukprot:jgi/Astpho2/5423/gw1.00076.40.1_t